jgi:PAS domain S-box-containing protein
VDSLNGWNAAMDDLLVGDSAAPTQAVDPPSSMPAGSWDGLADQLPVAVYRCDRDGLLLGYNRRAAELWGRSPALGDARTRFCGARAAYGVDGEPLAAARTPMAELLRTGQPVRDRELVLERSDGTRVAVLANIDPVLDPQGRLTGGVACLVDVSGARERERRLSELLAVLPAAVYTTDAAGRITFYNQAAVDLWGHRPELGDGKWRGSWRLYWPDGTPMPHDQCPMAVTLRENRPVRDAEAIAERPDGTRVPFIPYPVPLRDASGAVNGAVNLLVDITQRKLAEETQKLLVGELNHRVKNTLAIVQAVAQQTLRFAPSPGDFVESFGGRLQALSRAHTLLTQTVWRGADLGALVREQLLLGAADDGRIACSGPDVLLDPQLALHLAMVLHELGTNARKHGALSVSEGRLSVSWAVETTESRVLRLRWVEAGGPRVRATSARGFGTVLIEQSLKPHGGTSRLLSEASGVTWEIDLPLPATSAATGRGQAPASATPGGAGNPGAARPHGRETGGKQAGLAGRRVLLVEDEPLVALEIAGSLAELGLEVLGPAGTVEDAMRLVEESAPSLDGALLDANLTGRPVDEVAAALTRRCVPFVFVTGYGPESLPKAFQRVPILAKPFGSRELREAVTRLAAPRADANVLPIRGMGAAATA